MNDRSDMMKKHGCCNSVIFTFTQISSDVQAGAQAGTTAVTKAAAAAAAEATDKVTAVPAEEAAAATPRKFVHCSIRTRAQKDTLRT